MTLQVAKNTSFLDYFKLQDAKNTSFLEDFGLLDAENTSFLDYFDLRSQRNLHFGRDRTRAPRTPGRLWGGPFFNHLKHPTVSFRLLGKKLSQQSTLTVISKLRWTLQRASADDAGMLSVLGSILDCEVDSVENPEIIH